MTIHDIEQQTRDMIDDLKSICADFGIGNANSEYKIVTEVFLYKFFNDKFIAESRKQPGFENLDSVEIEKKIMTMSDEETENFLMSFQADTAILKHDHFISHLFNRQGEEDFHKLFDRTLEEIATDNFDIFSLQTGGQTKIKLFEPLSPYIKEDVQKDLFCRAIIDKLVKCSFESIFDENVENDEKHIFFSTIFKHIIKDYNKDFGKYSEYYTPQAIANIIADILVPEGISNVTVYDPAAGSGTLLLALAHQIGESNCSIYSQDISQKSYEFLRLNLILNNLVHSLPNIVSAKTLDNPCHWNKEKNGFLKFDYVVCNPPFKGDFSEIRHVLAGEKHAKRFFAGVPGEMLIYLLFIQHIIASMNETGKVAIVVPNRFLTPGKGIPNAIKEHLLKEKMLRGVITMPSKLFADAGANVSVLFLDKSANHEQILLMDASELGKIAKEGKTQIRQLGKEDIAHITQTFHGNKEVNNFSVVVSHDDLAREKNSLSPSQYFRKKTAHEKPEPGKFREKMTDYQEKLASFFSESEKLQEELMEQLKKLKYE